MSAWGVSILTGPDKRGPRRTKATGRPSSRKGRLDTAKRVVVAADVNPPDSALRCIEEVAQGKTLRSACYGGSDPVVGAPKYETFHYWLVKYPALMTAYRDARGISAHALFDEAIDEARLIQKTAKTPAAVNAMRLLIETLKWAAAKLSPSEYGDKITAPGGVSIVIQTTLPMLEAAKVEGTENVFEVTAQSVSLDEPPQPPRSD